MSLWGGVKSGASKARSWAASNPQAAGPSGGVRTENIGDFAVMALIIFFIDFFIFAFQRGIGYITLSLILYSFLAVYAYFRLRPAGDTNRGWVVGMGYLAILSALIGIGNEAISVVPNTYGFPMIVIYVALAVMFASAIAPGGASHFFIWCMRKSLFAWALPAVIAFLREDLSLLTQFFYDQGVAFWVGALLSAFLYGWLKHFMVYFGGWAGWAVHAMASNGSKVFKYIDRIVWIFYTLLLIGVFFSTAQANYDFAAAGENYAWEVPTTGQIWNGSKTFATGWFAVLFDPTAPIPGGADATIDRTTGAIRDTVEYSQNRDLGVTITNQRAIKTPYFVGLVPDSEDRLLQKHQDNSILWTGELRAQTFAEDMHVDLSCIYDRPSGDLTINDVGIGPEDSVGTVRPSSWTVRRTGELFDTFGYECIIKMEDFLKVDGQQASITDLTGQFRTLATFHTQSWGFTELYFMDADQHRAMRSTNINPATELGISALTRPLSVPGPVGIGLLDRVTQPIPVDVDDPSTLFIPSFGVSINNRWLGRGDFVSDDKHKFILNLSIPKPFELDVRYNSVFSTLTNLYSPGELDEASKQIIRDQCVGLDKFENLIVQPDKVRPYTNYIFIGLEFDDRQRDLTIRCPFKDLTEPQRQELLGPGNSPRVFTFTAQANFTYQVHANALVSVQVKEEDRP